MANLPKPSGASSTLALAKPFVASKSNDLYKYMNPITEIVNVSECRHYAGHAYGAGSFNPYESIAKSILLRETRTVILRAFESYLSLHRPRSFGDLFNDPSLGNHPLWRFPWSKPRLWRKNPNGNWWTQLSEVPDVMCHFADQGIPGNLVDEELKWHEEAAVSIAKWGYAPEQFDSYIEVISVRQKAYKTFLVADGNHRLAAISALGETHVKCRIVRQINLNDYRVRWLCRLNGFAPEDVQTLFSHYLSGRPPRKTSNYNFVPARVVR